MTQKKLADDYLGQPIHKGDIVLYARGGTNQTGFYGGLWKVLRNSAKGKGNRIRIEPYPENRPNGFTPLTVFAHKLVVYNEGRQDASQK